MSFGYDELEDKNILEPELKEKIERIINNNQIFQKDIVFSENYRGGCENCSTIIYSVRDCSERGYESRSYFIGYHKGREVAVGHPDRPVIVMLCNSCADDEEIKINVGIKCIKESTFKELDRAIEETKKFIELKEKEIKIAEEDLSKIQKIYKECQVFISAEVKE